MTRRAEYALCRGAGLLPGATFFGARRARDGRSFPDKKEIKVLRFATGDA